MANPNPSPLNPPSMSSPNPNPSPSAPLYPTLDPSDLSSPLFPPSHSSPSPQTPSLQTLIQIPCAILHLIDRQQSVELACGAFTLVRLDRLAVLASVGPDCQWPLTRDGAAVRLDDEHYFFTMQVPPDECEKGGPTETLNYGLTLPSKGQESVLQTLDSILTTYTNFSVQTISTTENSLILDRPIGTSPKTDETEGEMERKCAAYWTTLAPNVEEYGGAVAKAIASGSGKVIKGILWCGDVTSERIKWGNEYFKKRLKSGDKERELSPETLKRIKRVKKVTKMSEKVATGILSGVIKVSGFVMGSVANSKAGKKILNLLPEEIILASLDGFGKICDAVEVAGKNVLSTSSTVTTDLVSYRYGDKAAEATNEGLDAAGHAIGTAWAVFKIRKALDPKAVIKPTTLAKSAVKAAASEIKSKKGSK